MSQPHHRGQQAINTPRPGPMLWPTRRCTAGPAPAALARLQAWPAGCCAALRGGRALGTSRTSKGIAPTHCVASTTSAAPTRRQARPIAARSIISPSVQPHGGAHTTAVRASIDRRIARVAVAGSRRPLGHLGDDPAAGPPPPPLAVVGGAAASGAAAGGGCRAMGTSSAPATRTACCQLCRRRRRHPAWPLASARAATTATETRQGRQ
jgi:hypothetical protein